MMRVALSLLFLAVIAAGKKRLSREEIVEEDGEDVRRAIPGEPGRDYPTLAEVPATSFSCGSEGFFADPETRCQVFHICALQSGVMGRQSFLCPNGTIFNAHVNTCDWWNKVHCDVSLGLNLEAVYNSQLYLETKAPQQQNSQLKDTDRPKLTSRRRKPSESGFKPFSETSNTNFNAVESRQSQVLRNRGSIQVINHGNYQDLVDYNRQPSSNSISTEEYHQSTTQNSGKILGTKSHSTTFSDSSRVTEVTIKPRVRYTHSLRASSDDPLYSLNPLIHLARDSSLLSTFTTSSDSSNKVTHPMERYVVNDVLPQYKYLKDVSPANTLPKTPTIQPGNYSDLIYLSGDNNDQMNHPDDKTSSLYFPENSNPLVDDVVKNFEVSLESNGIPQGGVDGGYNKDGTVLTLAKPNESSNNDNGANKYHINLQVNSNALPPTRKTTSNDQYPLVRVTSGYRFTPTDVNGYNTPKTVKVTHSYSVEENFSTGDPEINNRTKILPGPLRNEGHTERNSISENEEPFKNRGISRDGVAISINEPQNVPGSNSVPSEYRGGFEDNYNAPGTFNDTNVEFINRFIVNEPSPQLPNTNIYNPNSFGTHTYTTPRYTTHPISNNYLSSSSSAEANLFSGISETVEEDVVTQPPPNAIHFSHSSSGYDENNVLNTTPKPLGVSYNNIPGHYITREPPEISNIAFNPGNSQNYELKSGDVPFIQSNQQNQKSFSSLSTVQPMRENHENLRNIYYTTQTPEVVMTSPVNHEKSTFSQPLKTPNTLNPKEKHVSNKYDLSTGHPVDYGVPTTSYYSSGSDELISQGHGLVSTEIPTQYQPYHQTFSPKIPQYVRYPPVQLQFPVPGTENVLSTDKSVEIVDRKEKENIFSGLKIDNVLPSIEAYSWSKVITPPTMTEEGLKSQTIFADYQDSSTTSFTPLLDSYNNRNAFREVTKENLSPYTESDSRASTASPPPPSIKTFFSSDSFSIKNFSNIHHPQKNYSFSTTDKTTATFLSNNEEVNLYTASNIGEISPSVEQYTSLSNENRPTSSSETSNSQRLENDLSTERSYFQKSTPFHKTLVTTKFTPDSDKDYGSTKYLSSSEGISSLTSSTPKPFLESHVAPQRLSTLLPDYKEEGKQLLNPGDLLRINSLRSSADLKKDGNVESAELIKSISFSFDDAEDLEQFEIAKSKGWFSL